MSFIINNQNNAEIRRLLLEYLASLRPQSLHFNKEQQAALLQFVSSSFPCESLDNRGKQELYSQILEEAKYAIESNNIDHLKKLSEVAVAIEEASEKELIRSFDDENPLREANIARGY